MKKIIGLALLASAAATAASAEPAFSGNVALTSDYVFRGVSQSDSEIAVQGGFDVTNDIFYAGAWASSIDFGPAAGGTAEVDVYAGVRPVLGAVTLDFGVIGYFYPGMNEAGGAPETDMWEFKAGASIAPAEGLTLGGALYYSPDFTLTAGDESGLYAEVNAAFVVSDAITLSGAFGSQDVDQIGYYGAAGDSYTTWNVGGTASLAGFGVDLRYTDTDLDPELFGPSGDEVSDGRVVLTVKRAL